jgi:acetoacetate decarboxylase
MTTPLYGLLDRDQLGISAPPISPLYEPTPTPNIGIEAMTISFETDSDAALAVLPRVLELRLPARAYMNVLHIPRSSMGDFCEASLFIGALFKGRPCRYAITMMVTNDEALCLGREILGSPKKLGVVRIENRPEGILGYVERPAGNRLVTAGMSLQRSVDPSTIVPSEESSVALRMIRNPAGAEPKGVEMHLIESRASWEVLSQWTGPGSLQFHDVIGFGTWRILPVKSVAGATFGRYNVVIPEPRLMACL